jgi:hypothetical protein
MPRSKSVILEGRLLSYCTTGLPPDLQAGGLEEYSVWHSAVSCGPLELEQWQGVQNLLWVFLRAAGRNVPCGHHGARRGKIPKKAAAGGWSLVLSCTGGTVGSVQGFSH